MRNDIDLTSVKKVDLIRSINNMIRYTNKLMKSRGCHNTSTCYSEATLRNKSRDYVEECYEHAWVCLREEIRAYYSILDVDVDKSTIDELKKNLNDRQEEVWQRYKNLLTTREAYLYEEICNHIKASGLLFDETEITIEDIDVKINSDELLNISLKDCFGGVINYYHKHSWRDESKESVDEINFGTIGAFNLDSLRGRQQMFLMGVICSLRDKTIRKKIAEVMDEIHSVNRNRYRINNQLECDLVNGLDEILSPFINKVAAGEIE